LTLRQNSDFAVSEMRILFQRALARFDAAASFSRFAPNAITNAPEEKILTVKSFPQYFVLSQKYLLRRLVVGRPVVEGESQPSYSL
jgi:hypothetical protein